MYKRQDLTSSQFATKLEKGRSDVELGEQVGESKDQIRRYIRLTNLIDPILDMVDNNQIAMNAAVEISYLGSKEQAAVMQSIEKEETSPSIDVYKRQHIHRKVDYLNHGKQKNNFDDRGLAKTRG